MTYPKVSTTGEHTGAAFGVPASPRFPQIEDAVLARWAADDTFAGVDRQPAGGGGRRERVRLLRRPALRQRPAALRPPAHRLRQGHRPPLRDDARPPRRAPLRLGHPRAARRARGDEPARHQDQGGDPRARHRDLQRQVPRLGHEVHRRVARVRHPPGPLGRLRQRLQDAQPDLHGVGAVGVQDALRQGPGLRGLPLPALLLERPDAAVQPRAADGRGGLQEPAGPGGHRRLPARDRRARPHLDDDARGPCRATSRWPCAPTSTTSSWSRTFTGRTERYLLAEARLAAYARELGDDVAERVVERLKGSDLVGRSYTPPFSYYVGHAKSHVVLAADYVTTDDGTGIVHIAPAFGEEDKQLTDQHGIAPVVPVGPDGRFTFPVDRLRGPARLRRQRPRSSSTSRRRPAGEGDRGVGHRRHRAAAPRDLRPLLPALLALPRAPHLHGGVLVVRRGDEVQGPHGRAQPGDHLGARARQGRPVRQVARERP